MGTFYFNVSCLGFGRKAALRGFRFVLGKFSGRIHRYILNSSAPHNVVDRESVNVVNNGLIDDYLSFLEF
jgi:hypothetical protein